MGESSKQVSLEDNGHVEDIDIIKAQVIWLLKMIDSGYSIMFHDSSIAIYIYIIIIRLTCQFHLKWVAWLLCLF